MTMLDHYLAAFAKLKVDKARWKDSPATNRRAPYKPFLLLAVLDLIAQGQIPVNLITLTPDLREAFTLYCDRVLGVEKSVSIALPYYHLKSDDFWHLIATPGNDAALAAPIRSLALLQQLVAGVRLDDDLYTLLLNADTRDRLRQVLIETYFAPEMRPVVAEVGIISAQSFSYSQDILERPRRRPKFTLEEAPTMDEAYVTEARTAGFRKAIVNLYQHTCALCKIRLVTPEGRTAVSAAHIVPFSHSNNDDPRNGIALCGLHHWAFDTGVVAISDKQYTIKVSPVIPTPPDDPRTAALWSLADQPILLPDTPSTIPLPLRCNGISAISTAAMLRYPSACKAHLALSRAE